MKIINKISKLMQDDDFPYAMSYDWEHKEVIGEGGFGKVYKVYNKHDKKYYAIKQIAMEKFNEPFKLDALKCELKATK